MVPFYQRLQRTANGVGVTRDSCVDGSDAAVDRPSQADWIEVPSDGSGVRPGRFVCFGRLWNKLNHPMMTMWHSVRRCCTRTQPPLGSWLTVIWIERLHSLRSHWVPSERTGGEIRSGSSRKCGRCAPFFFPLIYRTTLTISVKVTCWRQLYCVDHKLILVFDWIDNFVWNLNWNLNWRAKPQNWSMDVRYCDGMFGSFFINATRFVYFFIHFFFFFFFFLFKRQFFFFFFFFVVFNRMGLCSDRKDGTGRHFSNWSRPSASVGRSTHHTAVRMAGNVRRFFGVTFC